jgi:flagellar hook-associated protein 1
MTGILNNALSGLQAFQAALVTTSNNISNANTPGYDREQVQLSANPSEYTGFGYLGQGVNVTGVTRQYDAFITGQLRSSNAAYGDANTYYQMASQVDNIIANSTTGLAPTLQNFFSAVQGVANDPSSTAARQSMVSQAGIMTQNFNTMASDLSSFQSQVNSNVSNDLANITQYAQSIASLNTQIVADIAKSSSSSQPNQLEDQRDQLLANISKLVDVSTVQQSDGSVNVFIGQGQPLVVGTYASTLTAQASSDNPNQLNVLLNGQDVTNQISGGDLSGNLRFQNQILDPTQQQMGLLAAGVAESVNNVNQAGYDLSGNQGQAIFNLGTIPVTSTNNSSVVTATYSGNPANLSASDYQVTVTGPGPSYTLTRLSDNTTINMPGGNDPGFTLNFDGTEQVGDTFLVQPTYAAAASISVNISDPSKIAAAQTAAGVPGDNSNALAMASLQTQKTLLSGQASFSDAYGQLVAKVGTMTNSAQTAQTAQNTLLQQATQSQQAVSGVSLDQEATNLIQFQNAYQAASKVISTVNSMFSTLMNAVG